MHFAIREGGRTGGAGVVAKVIDGIKVLGTGELTKKLTVKANAFSEAAKEKILAKGGNVEVI